MSIYSAFFDLAVNREVGTTANKQWVQPVDSVIIAGMYIHCLPVAKLYVNGYNGWWTIASSVFESIRTHKFLRDRSEDTVAGNETGADQGTRIPAQGQRRTSSQPPVKSARSGEPAPDDSSSPSPSSSNSEADNTAKGLSRLSLTPGDVTILSRQAPANPPDWTCKNAECQHVMKDECRNCWQCTKCGQWRTQDFEQYENQPQRGRSRNNVD